MKKDMIKVYVLIIVGVIILTVVGTTFAFFSLGVVNEGASGVTYELTDKATLTFEKGDELVIDASLENFSATDGNLSSTTTAKVTLDATENYTSEYYVYFQINSNDFVYTTEDETAELVLKITGPNGEVKSIDGLDYVTSGGVSGFDITTVNEYLIEIATPEWLTLNYSASNTSISNEWTFTLYFINLDTNQNDNSGKTFDSEIVMTGAEYKMPVELYRKILINSTEESEWTIAEILIQEKEIPTFLNIADTEEGMFTTEDDYGISYYYRGYQENNYVLFADMLWRIVRVDGAGNIRLMLFNEEETATEYSSMDNGTKYAYSDRIQNFNYFAGYRYVSTVYDSGVTGTTLDSDIKSYIDTWYENNFLDTEYEKSLALDAIYCNNRSVSGTPSMFSIYYFINYTRINSTKLPTMICSDFDDSFSSEENEYGNGELKYPIALLSADEVMFAGGTSSSNSLYYLNTGVIYWTMSPSYNYYKAAQTSIYTLYFYNVQVNGTLYYYGNASTAASVFPIISLKSGIMSDSGDGSLENPYTIKM